MAVVDFMVRRPNGEPLLLVEAKNKRHTNSSWATQVRRNLMSHIALRAPYFLLATPDRFYFWVDGASPEPVPPSVEMDAHKVLLPYFETARVGRDNFSGPTFEFIVSAWLRELIDTRLPPKTAQYPDLLQKSGFFDALSGSSVSYQPSL